MSQRQGFHAFDLHAHEVLDHNPAALFHRNARRHILRFRTQEVGLGFVGVGSRAHAVVARHFNQHAAAGIQFAVQLGLQMEAIVHAFLVRLAQVHRGILRGAVQPDGRCAVTARLGVGQHHGVAAGRADPVVRRVLGVDHAGRFGIGQRRDDHRAIRIAVQERDQDFRALAQRKMHACIR
ncbi:hypothetical protein D3C72_928790 [compost metagenome]